MCRSQPARKEIAQQRYRIGDVESAIVVDVTGIIAIGITSHHEQDSQCADGIGDVDLSILITISTDKVIFDTATSDIGLVEVRGDIIEISIGNQKIDPPIRH